MVYKVRCLYDHNYVEEEAYDVGSFPYQQLKAKTKKKYIEIPATFDIESTTLSDQETPEAYMYIWQMCVEGYVCFGRTWAEWLLFLDKLNSLYQLNDDNLLVIYVHNLSFEFEFVRDFLDISNIFATDKRKVLKFNTSNGLEFRCSYRLSNMNLAKFIENSEGTHHNKGIDDLDYRKIRTPETELTDVELGYCYNDVMGLYEAVCSMLNKDDLKSIPLTSTGYVRRDCRNAMRKDKNNRKQFKRIRLYKEVYQLLRRAFRGGNTASSRYHADKILENVGSYDISSSYPYVMISSDQFPVTKFFQYTVYDFNELLEVNRKYCTVADYIFINLRLKKGVPIPYLPSAKAKVKGATVYNGRILKADEVQIALTNIDMDIVLSQYDFDDIMTNYIYAARRGFLPLELREQIFSYFEKKSVLKGVEGMEYEYSKSKNKLNSTYGMCVTDILHNEITLNDSGEWIVQEGNIDEQIDNYYKNYNNFLSYQWGVWVTALARQRLQMGIDRIGLDTVYCDTDSIKYLGQHTDDFRYLNEEMIAYNKEHNIAHSVEVNGKEYMMGQWDIEQPYDHFITLGAKKYAYDHHGKIGVTVAGLSKKKGAEELTRGKGLEDFVNGKVFNDSGRTVAYFNNMPIHELIVDNVRITTGSNIAIVDTTYTLGITDLMLNIIFESENE